MYSEPMIWGYLLFISTVSPSAISSDPTSPVPVTGSSVEENLPSVPNASDDLHLVSPRLTRPSLGARNDEELMTEINVGNTVK